MRPQPQIEEPLFRVRYDERPIERYAECMEMDIFNAGRDGATEYVHGKLASRIGLKLADEGFIKFETNEKSGAPWHYNPCVSKCGKTLNITEPCRAVRKDEFSWLNTNYRIKRLS